MQLEGGCAMDAFLYNFCPLFSCAHNQCLSCKQEIDFDTSDATACH